MKKLIGFLLVIVVFSLVVGTILQMVPPLPALASSFLKAVETKYPAEAYDLFTDEYKASHSKEDYLNWIQISGLSNYRTVQWAGKGNIVNDKGTLSGVIFTTSNDSFPVVFHFKRDQNQRWWIDSIEVRPQNVPFRR